MSSQIDFSNPHASAALRQSSQARDIERVKQRAKELQNDEQDKDPAV